MSACSGLNRPRQHTAPEPLTLHFVALGLGLAVVNGCVTPTPGLVGRPVTDLPEIPYDAIHRLGALDGPSVAGPRRTHLAEA